jgi:predicted dehydrogenase
MASSSRQKVRYAVVGLGNIAQVAVLPAFEHARENSELVALVSSDAKKLDTLGKRYGVSLLGSYDDLEAMIEEGEVDAAYVAVPNTLHREMTERIARAGAHVLCEKPMAMTVEECEWMIAATRVAGVKLMIAYRLHFDPANLRVIERIAAGEIGEPRLFSSVFTQQVREGDIRTKPELGGGAIYDMGIYCINAARYVFRDEPIEVYAQRVEGTDGRSNGVDEMTCAVLRFSDGRIAQLTASQGASPISEYRVVGTKGDIRLDPAFGYTEDSREHLTVAGKTKEKKFALHDQFAAELIHFSHCIMNELEPEPSGEEGLADVRILQALKASAEMGAAVRLPPFQRTRRPTSDLAMSKPAPKHVKPIHAPSPSR